MTTPVTISPTPILQFFDNAGRPCAGGSVLTQVASVNYATWQDSAGNTPLPNPIPLNSRGEVSNAAGVSCQLFLQNGIVYTFTLSDADGNVLNQAAYVASNNILSELASTASTTTSGGTLVGVLQAGTGAVGRTVQDWYFDRVSALDFMTDAQRADVRAGTKTLDVTAAVQAAVTAAPSVYFPKGAYKITSQIAMRADSQIYGEHSQQTQIAGTHAGNIFFYPNGNNDCRVDNIYFAGTGCTAIAVDQTGGGLAGYLTRAKITNCNFAWELLRGIKVSSNGCVIKNNQFGQTGTGTVATSGFVAIELINVGINTPNITVISENGIFNAGGTKASPNFAVIITNGTDFDFSNNNLEGCPRVLHCQSGLAKIEGNWVEQCGANALNFQTPPASGTANGPSVGSIIVLDDCFTSVAIKRNNFLSSTCLVGPNAFVQWNGNANIIPGQPGGIDFEANDFGLSTGQYPFYNGNLTSYTLDPNRIVAWRKNVVTGGNAGNKLVQALNFDGPGAFLARSTIDSSGSVTFSTDPGLSVAHSVTGTYTLTYSNPVGATVGFAPPLITPQNGSSAIDIAVNATDLFTVVVTCKGTGGAALDVTFSIWI